MERRITNPLIGLVLVVLSFSAQATTAPAEATAPQRFGLFEEPLVAFESPTETQRAALEKAVSDYAQTGDPSRIGPLVRYLKQRPLSPWRASLMVNLGMVQAQAGRFSEAIDLLEQARMAAAQAETAPERAIKARAAGELLKLHTVFGHKERVASLLETVEATPASAAVSEIIASAKAGLWQMNNEPQQALRCGIIALESMRASLAPEGSNIRLDHLKAGPNGTTLAQLAEMSGREGLPVRAVSRASGEPIPVPSVVHWRVGHYAAIVGKENGRYRVTDPAFGDVLWMTPEAIEAEASGYFLVPEKSAEAKNWRTLAKQEAEQVIGGGYTSDSQPEQTSCDDPTECGGSCGDSTGMPRYRVHSMLVSLNIKDTPVGYKPPVGPPVRATLTYSQREAYQPSNFNFFNLGPKWLFNWLSYIQDDPRAPGSRVRIYLPGGGTRDYRGYNSSRGQFAPEQRTGAHLVRIASSPVRYERRMANGTKFIYGESDDSHYYPRRIFLTQVVDASGNAVTLHYDEQLRLTKLTDAIGQATKFTYADPQHPLRITAITDPFGRDTTIGYDDQGRLNAITDAVGMSSTFEYDNGTFIKAMTTPYGTTRFAYGQSGTTRWLEITDPKGEKERVEYRHGAPGIPFSDSPVPAGMKLFNSYINGRNTFYWDKEAMKRAPGDYTQARIRHWYHLRTNSRHTTGVLESVKNPLENRIWYNYPGQDWAGAEGTLDKPSKIGRVLPDGTTQLTQKSYNAFGNVTRTVDPEGREVLYEYADNQIDLVRIKRKSQSGYDVIAQYTYDDHHHPLTYAGANGATTTFTYNTAGQVTSATNPLGHKTRYEYDDNGYLLVIIDPNGSTWVRYTYDEVGRIASKTDSAGYTLRYGYDALDRLIRISYPDGTQEHVNWERLDVKKREDRYGNVTEYVHNPVRDVLSETDPAGNTTSYGYFANGQLESVTDANGNTTRYERDIQRRKIREVRADGSDTTHKFDKVGRHVLSTDTLGGETKYGYSRDDRLRSVSDPNGNITTYHYDRFSGQLIERRSPDTGITTYQYDAAGNLTKQTDASGSTTVYSYDPLGRTTRVVYADGKTVDYRYDTAPNGMGRLAEIHEDSGTTAYEYDVTGRVAARTQSGPDGTSFTLRYSYNDAGMPIRLTYPSGAVVEYDYDKERLSAIRLDGRVVLEDVAYEPFGALASWRWGNGASSRRTYEPNGWLNSYSAADDVRQLTYDPVGNITAITGAGLEQQYVYDPLARLTKAVSGDFDLGYAYDANGNRTEGRDGDRSESYANVPGSNRLASVDEVAYLYDANGNVIQDGDHAYTYDARNRITAVDDGETATYAYNALGQRVYKRARRAYQLSPDLNGDGQVSEADLHTLHEYISRRQSPPEADLNQDGAVDVHDTPCIATRIGDDKRQTGGEKPDDHKGKGHGGPHACRVGEWIETVTETRFVYEGPNLLGEYAADGTPRQEIIWMNNTPVALLKDGIAHYIHTNQIGAPVAITNTSGSVVWRWEPRPFGDTLAEEDPDGDTTAVSFNLRFPGQYFDQETGLHYNYFRDYDPNTGRYVESDPIGLEGGLNTYTYVYNNPLNYTDPTGEFGLVGAGIGAILDLGGQLLANGGNWNCVSWTQVGVAGALGAVGGGALGGVFKHAVSGKKWSQLSKAWKNVSPRYRKAQQRAGNAPDGDWDAHHWAFPRRGETGPTWRNHPANLNPVPREIHQRIHGNHPTLDQFGPLGRWWYGTPEWAKAAQGSLAGGLAGDAATAGDCGCQN